MTYGVASKKTACGYQKDDGVTELMAFHTADIISAGSFIASPASDDELIPSKGRLIQRHLGLVNSDGTKRTKLPIGQPTTYAAITIGSTITYGGITWTVVSKTGEKLRTRP